MMVGIDMTVFTAHSTGRASSSAAADSGITTGDILKTADWSTKSVSENSTTVSAVIPLMAEPCYIAGIVRHRLIIKYSVCIYILWCIYVT